MATHIAALRRSALGCISAGMLASMISLTALGASSGAASGAPVITNFPRVAVAHGGVFNTWAASNWSGYAETGTFTGVTSTWTVPTVAPTSAATYSSAWIGVDGFNNSSLIQTGTEEDYYSGGAHYSAWWEILPAAETPLPGSYAVAAGDRMSASIDKTTGTITSGRGFRRTSEPVWTVTISDKTKGWTFSTNQGYTGAGSSAEWIVEAPEVGGRIATMAHYTVAPPAGTGDFDNAGVLSTVVSGGSPTYKGAALNYANDSGVMIQNSVQVSTPGNPDSPLTAFNAAYGSALPATPSG